MQTMLTVLTPIMKLTVLGIIGGAALLTAVPLSLVATERDTIR